MRSFDVVVPDAPALDAVAARIAAAGLEHTRDGDGVVGVSDPSGNALRVRR